VNQHLTIAYCTSRKEPKLEWFWQSLDRQIKPDDDITIVLVDFHAHTRSGLAGRNIIHVPPKPTVWQGPHRLTKEDWFAAANARNTALCLAPDGYIAYVDDLSVLMPGWLDCVKAAMKGRYVVCGAYRKVDALVIDDGIVKSFSDIPDGHDTRLAKAKKDISPCTGYCLFGCSLAGPVEAFLSVNGWPEDLCDGMGYEDTHMGVVMANAGIPLKYDRRMMTFEDAKLHFSEIPFRRADLGDHPKDKSHAALDISSKIKRFPNDSLGRMEIRGIRQQILRGMEFPVRTQPHREWFTGTPLSEL